MCGAGFPWDWFILDFAYVLVLLGGAMTLRAKGAMPVTWVLFGVLAISVGAGLVTGTYITQRAFQDAVLAAKEGGAFATAQGLAACG
ncbi:MAG TPA: hypothetical protein VM889_00765 [Candidatus Thermoplasmatota archaeon]|nr:hypothetical protein [Candidatus Thermoplasmatota archaeon]